MRSLRKSLKIVVSSIAIKFVMFFVCLPTEHLAVELKRVRACFPSCSRSNWNLEVFVFKERGKVRSTWEIPLGARERTNNKLNPHGSHLWIFFNSHDGYKIDQVMNEMGVNASESDTEILKQVCAAVSIRAARLAAAGIAAIIKVC